jgi:sugar lactone lactonase YvrE
MQSILRYFRFIPALLFLTLPLHLVAQRITTVAGNGTRGFAGDGGPATSALINNVFDIDTDENGNLFIADADNNRIRKVSPDGTITTVAGNGTAGFSGDGGPATAASLRSPNGVLVGADGNLFIADRSNNRIRKVSPDGIITTIAGTGASDFSGDGGPATKASLFLPSTMAMDARGNLFISQSYNQRVRKVSPDGIISTAAGNGAVSPDPNGIPIGTYSGDGGPATEAGLGFPSGLAVDGQGNLFIADQFNARIRKVSPDGIITTIAGSGTRGFSGDGGPATSAALSRPFGLAIDGVGNLFFSDHANYRIRKIDLNGIITTVAGNGNKGFIEGGRATASPLPDYNYSVSMDVNNNLFVAADTRIYKVNAVTSMFTVKPGNWNDAATWSANRLPRSTDILTLNHAVTLPTGYTSQVQRLIYSTSGRILFSTDSRLSLVEN